MKLQCELCREIVVADLAIDGARIKVRCPSCDGTFAVPVKVAADAKPAEAAPDGPTMACPKCGLDQRVAPACRACGLLASRMPDFTASDRASVPPEVADAWDACLAAWTDPMRHEDLARVAATYDVYAWVARRYHERLRDDPTDAVAASRQAAIARITEASLRASAASRRGAKAGAGGPSPYKSAMTFLVVLVLLAACGTVYALFATSSSDTAAGDPIPVLPVVPVLPHSHR